MLCNLELTSSNIVFNNNSVSVVELSVVILISYSCYGILDILFHNVFQLLNFCCRLFGFNGGKLRMDERIDLSMSDPDLVPLIVQVWRHFSIFCCFYVCINADIDLSFSWLCRFHICNYQCHLLNPRHIIFILFRSVLSENGYMVY